MFGRKKEQERVIQELAIHQRLDKYDDMHYNSEDLAWLKNLADSGVPLAQHLMGLYEMNYGDSKKVFYWFSKAAMLGYASSELALGFIYESRNDFTEAAKWYYKAAKQGLDDAIYFMGKYYLYGVGVAKDVNKGIQMLADIGRNRDHEEACYLLGCFYLERQANADDLMEAEYWLSPIASEGNMNAKTKLGILYLNPKHKLYNPDYGVMLLREAAAAGDNEAMAKLRAIGK